jgi:hypothetical protein
MINKRDELTKHIAHLVSDCDGVEIVEPIQIGQGAWRNELLLFIKPEIFMVGDKEKMANTVSLVFRKLEEFDAYHEGIMMVGGKVLEEKAIMSQHYGFINRLSVSASQILDADDRGKVYEAAGVSGADGYKIYGGHEYLTAHPGEDLFGLDKLWFTKKSIKLRSGFYVQAYEKDREKFILVNGFHPAQLAHFTDPSHRIVLFLIHSNSNWSALKNQMVGATFPEKAVSESIRGILFARPHDFGLETVSIANNGVHLSAGPFEGVFEVVNFFGKILGVDPEKTPSLAIKKMVQAGIEMGQALTVLKNPILRTPEKLVDLFTATEDMDSEAAIETFQQNMTNIIGYSRE